MDVAEQVGRRGLMAALSVQLQFILSARVSLDLGEEVWVDCLSKPGEGPLRPAVLAPGDDDDKLHLVGYVERWEPDEEPDIRRYDGNALCEQCERPVWRHPLDPGVLDYEGNPFVHRLCDGTLAKT